MCISQADASLNLSLHYKVMCVLMTVCSSDRDNEVSNMLQMNHTSHPVGNEES